MTGLENDPSVTPLEEIERRAQDRAKRLAGGMDVAHDELRSIVMDEVDRWNLDYQRGIRSVEVTDPVGVADRALRNLSSYGPLTPLLGDDDVWEIAINAPDAIFVKRHDGPSGFHDEVFHDDEHVLRTLTRLLDDVPGAHRKLDPAEGLQDARLDDGSRVHIVHGDIGRAGHLLVNIRRFTGVPIRSLDELVDMGTLEPAIAAFLRACMRARVSIVFGVRPARARRHSCPAAWRSSIRHCASWSPKKSSRLTYRCPTSRRCRPVRLAPTVPRSTSDDSSPASFAWLPMSPL